MLNCTRTVLLTNNRATLYGFTKTGIEIASRMPLEAPINADNRRDVTAKAARCRTPVRSSDGIAGPISPS
jgi:GTP cyclohydrolase II